MKMLTVAASLAAVLVSAGTAMAVPVSGVPIPAPTPAKPAHHGQFHSNQSLRTARRHVEVAIDRLQSDAWDYGGHKEKAIDDLGVARQFIEQGLAYLQSHPGNNSSATGTTGSSGSFVPANPGGVLNSTLSASAAGSTGSAVSTGTMGSTASQVAGNQGVGGQQGSNENINAVRGHIQKAIAALESDNWDYGGFKERAIDKLNAADQEMQAAISFVHKPGVQNGSHNPHLSDANLNYVKEHVETAIARLNQDSHDYGGHRAAAVSDLQQADSYINSALSYDGSHDRFNSAPASSGKPGFSTMQAPVSKPAGAISGIMQPGTGTPTLGQGNSNDSLRDARTHLEWAIDAMQRDLHDYGGFRAKAVASMEAARTQLEEALQFRSTGHN